jgi:DNA-binding CsgD family transcriptional regulator
MENTVKVAKDEKIEIAETAVQFFGRQITKLKDNNADVMTLIQQYQMNKDFSDLAMKNRCFKLADKFGKFADEAFEVLLARYHKLFFKAFHNLKTTGLSLNDNEVLSACTDGFMSALMEYKGEKLKFAFTTIMYRCIKHEVSKTLAKIGKAISYNQTVLYRVKQVSALRGRGKSVEEISSKMGITTDEVVKLGGVFGKFQAIYIDDCDTTEPIFACDNDYRGEILDEMEVLIKLCPNERVGKVMERVAKGMKYQQIADELGINLSMVKHDYLRGIEYLKKYMTK